MGRPRRADGVLVGGISRLAVKPNVADAVRAEATLRGITLSVAVLEMLALYRQDRLQPKTVVDPPRQTPAPRRRPREPLIVQVPTLLSRINDQLRPVDPPSDPAVEAPTRPLTRTMPSPASAPAASPPEPFLDVWNAALREHGHEPRTRSVGHVAALREIYVSAVALAGGRGLEPLELFKRWVDAYLDDRGVGGDAPSAIAMAMNLYRLMTEV